MPKGKAPAFMQDWRQHAIMQKAAASDRPKSNYKAALDLHVSSGNDIPWKWWIVKEQLGDTADYFIDLGKKVSVLGTTTWGSSWKPDEGKWVGIAKDGTVNALKLKDWLGAPEIVACLNNESIIGSLTFYNDKGEEIEEEDAIALNESFDPTVPVSTPTRRKIPSKRQRDEQTPKTTRETDASKLADEAYDQGHKEAQNSLVQLLDGPPGGTPGASAYTLARIRYGLPRVRRKKNADQISIPAPQLRSSSAS